MSGGFCGKRYQKCRICVLKLLFLIKCLQIPIFLIIFVALSEKYRYFMKRISLFVLSLPLLLASCGVTRIVTVAPAPEPVVVTAQPQTVVVTQPTTVYTAPVSTTVTYPRTHTTRTTTIDVTPLTQDISLYLDLQAVAAAFAQANSVEEFEMILNSNAYIISNLDLNHDGYIDYLRVLETIEGYNHVLLIQAVLAANIYQDVATLIVEMGYATPYVQVIGAPYIYGVNYIIEPVYYKRPPMYDRWGRPNYTYWRSPYYWDHFPHHYGHHAPYHLGHYQAYVTTYMENHHYCHTVHYVDHHHYSRYEDVSRPVSRNDYGQQYPEQSFSRRTTATYVPAGGSQPTRVSNARQLQQAVEQSGASRTTTSTRTTNTRSSGTTQSTRTTSTQQPTQQRTQSAQPAQQSTTSSRTTATQQQSTSSRTSSTQRKSETTTPTTQRKSEATTTTRVRTSGTTTTKRSPATNNTKSTTTRTSGTSTRTSGTSTRSSGSGSSTRTSGSSDTNTRNSGNRTTSTRK